MTAPDVARQVPALYGGPPVRATLLPYGHQEILEEDIEAVVQVLRSDWITTGPKVGEFEEAVAAYVGARFAVAFSSGTAALHGAAFAAGLGPGDEAITTPLTFCATSNCLLYVGATPVFADVSADTLNIDLARVVGRITPRTKAILPVDYAGHPADLDALLLLAEQHGLTVIEDAAHALGAEYKERKVGSISHMTMFSFHPVKHITTGEGGMITTDNPDFARRLRMFRTHGIDQQDRQTQGREKGEWHYEMTELGFNYRLPDIACALGLSQLRRLPQNIARRREITQHYSQALGELPGVILPTERTGVASSWHLYPIRLKLDGFSTGRTEIFRALRAEKIGVNVHYIPVHLHPYYKQRFGYQGGEFPVAESAYESLISLPMFHSMTDQDVSDVVEAVDRVVRHFAKQS